MGRNVKRVLWVTVVIYLASAWVAAWAADYDYATHVFTTDRPVTLQWDPVDGADFYEVRIMHVEHETEEPAGGGVVEENTITFQVPRSGHYVAKVRACLDGAAEPNCSDWSLSTDPERATVGGSARAWWLYGYLAPPGEVTIDGK